MRVAFVLDQANSPGGLCLSNLLLAEGKCVTPARHIDLRLNVPSECRKFTRRDSLVPI